MAEWVADAHSLPGSRSPSVSGASVSSLSSGSSVGTLRYMPPAKLRQYQQQRADLRLANAGADLSEANLRGLLAEKESQKHARGSLPEFRLPFFLPKASMDLLTSRFPRTTFRVESDNAHDHPLAHTENMIATYKVHRMVPAGKHIIDVYGSPARAQEFNRSQARSNNPKRCTAYVGLMSEKDYLRASTWGPTHASDGTLRYIEHAYGIINDLDVRPSGLHMLNDGVVPGTDVIWFCRNTMYYLSDEEIVQMLSCEGSRMLSVVHRHPNQQGSLFGGECTYGKISNTLEQVNVLTGERYVHRDLSFLWTSTSKVVRTSVGAYTWTFHMVSEDTWIVELVAVPIGMDSRFVKRAVDVGHNTAANEMNEHALVPTRFPHPALAQLPDATCFMVNSVPVIRFSSSQLPDCKLTCPALYEFLASNMVGKPRDSDRMNDLFALARSHVVNGQEFPGKRNFQVASGDIAAHVILAFVSGVTAEVGLLRAATAYRSWFREHTALVDGHAIVANTGGTCETGIASAHALLSRVNKARKHGDLLDGALAAFSNV